MSTELLSDKSVQNAKAKVTGLVRQYSDLNLQFRLHPSYGDVRPVKDLDAIKNSIRNILLTRKGERLFQPSLGCNLKRYLFEPASPITIAAMDEEIRYSLGTQEPRVEVQNIAIEDYSERNSYFITITVLIKNNQQEVDIELFLERLR